MREKSTSALASQGDEDGPNFQALFGSIHSAPHPSLRGHNLRIGHLQTGLMIFDNGKPIVASKTRTPIVY